ncbi:ABC transporter ATP-binding protein [Puniceicoccus vermicola]|uniref:ABC transporter ATP-binding protein n=1 Tax=Puniceicoccus vermicola TaxID=388746 RepID=A0A7X1AUW8_9BACT|nr:ABC transporter ATP-binding protein [Puniceicoccus vermicola]MBC2600387.1 ABC transporter ATP-binding protein [Puniceicoccus vermicola]
MGSTLGGAETGQKTDNWTLIKRLLRFAWQFRTRCLLVIVLQSLILCLTIGSVNLAGVAIDYLKVHLTGSGDLVWPLGIEPPPGTDPFHVILGIGLCVGLFAILRAILEYYNELSRSLLIHVDIVLRLRGLVYEKMQRLSFRFFDKNASGTLINRVTSDVQSTRAFIDQVVVQVFVMSVSLIVYLGYMLSYHVPLTLACLVTTPILAYASTWFAKKLRPNYLKNSELMDRMVLNFSESMQGIQMIKGFALEKLREKDFEEQTQAVRNKRQEIFWLTSNFAPFVGGLTQINLIVLLAYGGYLVIQGQLPLGTGLVAFAALLQQFSNQVANLAGIADSVQQSLTGARRVFEVLDAPVEIQSPENPVPLEKIQGEIRFEDVTFGFDPDRSILRNIDLEAKPGQIIAIAGATGSGKSQLMSLIPRFYDPEEGRVLLDGHDLREIDVKTIRRNVGIVFQENFLFSNSIAANISFGNPSATREQIEKAARIACAHDFIMAMPNGYDSILSESGSNLSGGQQQRLAIARAVLLEPSILLLDDPTAAIDPETEHEIMAAIDSAISGRTTFIVAHRLSTLRRADQVIVLDRGEIIQRGHHNELMQQEGLYRSAVQLQAIDPDSMALIAEAERRQR